MPQHDQLLNIDIEYSLIGSSHLLNSQTVIPPISLNFIFYHHHLPPWNTFPIPSILSTQFPVTIISSLSSFISLITALCEPLSSMQPLLCCHSKFPDICSVYIIFIFKKPMWWSTNYQRKYSAWYSRPSTLQSECISYFYFPTHLCGPDFLLYSGMPTLSHLYTFA